MERPTSISRMTPLPALALAALGCAADLRDDAGGGPHDAGPALAPAVTFAEHGDGTTTARVDATSNSDWIYLDLGMRAQVKPADPETSTAWHLGLQRFKVKLNGGSSGAGGGSVTMLEGADFAALEQAPAAAAWLADQPDSSDEDKEPDYAISSGDGAWFAYDVVTHVLTPRPVVYVLRTGDGRFFKLKMNGYYDMAGTAGYPSFTFAPLTAPAGDGTIGVDASDSKAAVYLAIKAGAVITVADPRASTEWDLAITRTQFQTNGGTSGGGSGGARLAPGGAAWDAIAGAPTFGFAEDQMLPLPGPPGSGEFSGNAPLNAWYDYDAGTHAVTPRKQVYLVRSAGGDYGKLEILTYHDGKYTLRLAPVSRDVANQTTTLDASSNSAAVYFSFRAGTPVMVADARSSRAWDVAVTRTRWSTNGGTSGVGQGGAADPGVPSLAQVASAQGLSFTQDVMIPLPGPPGSGEFSGSPTLNGWYDYNEMTHATTPKDKAFVVRTADGGFARFKLTSYAGGVYQLDWSYAGAARTDF